jgi:transcription initiation factor TFIID subunit 13
MAEHTHRRRNARKQNLFQKDCTSPSRSNLTKVKLLMYAFGDDPNPSPDSVAVLEDIVTEYINEMVPPPSPERFPKLFCSIRV